MISDIYVESFQMLQKDSFAINFEKAFFATYGLLLFVPKPISVFIRLEKSSRICYNKRRIKWEIDLPSSGNKVFKYKGLEFW